MRTLYIVLCIACYSLITRTVFDVFGIGAAFMISGAMIGLVIGRLTWSDK